MALVYLMKRSEQKLIHLCLKDMEVQLLAYHGPFTIWLFTLNISSSAEKKLMPSLHRKIQKNYYGNGY